MSRKLRIEYPGAMYHVMNRGDQREDIFRDDEDRQKFQSGSEPTFSTFRRRALTAPPWGDNLGPGLWLASSEAIVARTRSGSPRACGARPR